MNKAGTSRLNKIRYLDGTRLKNAIFAGIGHLAQYREYLNRINVFPVPDGDTGTNMVLTMHHISSGLANLADKSILAKRFNISGEIPILEAGPALGVHAGPGTVGFSFTGYK